jgi:hypothetical protein
VQPVVDNSLTSPEQQPKTRRKYTRKRKADGIRQPAPTQNEPNPSLPLPEERNADQDAAVNDENQNDNEAQSNDEEKSEDDEQFFDANHQDEYLGQSEIEEDDTIVPEGNKARTQEDQDAATIIASQESSHVSNTPSSVQQPQLDGTDEEPADENSIALSDIRRRIRDTGRDISIAMGFCNVIHYPEEETYEVSALNDAPAETLEEMQVSYDLCAYCQGHMASVDKSKLVKPRSHDSNEEDYDTDSSPTDEPYTCTHEYHVNCFLSDLQKRYIESEMNSNRPHLLKPAVKCCQCNRLVLWENQKKQTIDA